LSRVDVMVDIETLGTGADSTIFQIAAMAFDIRTGKPLSFFDEVADIEKNSRPLKVDGSTLKWWLNTDKELLTDLLNKGDMSSEELLHSFYVWLNNLTEDIKDVYLWGNGIIFDNKMIQHQLIELGLDYPIHYKNDRDVRTLLELASIKTGLSEREIKDRFEDEDLREHNAMDDVIYHINLAIYCFRVLTEGEE